MKQKTCDRSYAVVGVGDGVGDTAFQPFRPSLPSGEPLPEDAHQPRC